MLVPASDAYRGVALVRHTAPGPGTPPEFAEPTNVEYLEHAAHTLSFGPATCCTRTGGVLWSYTMRLM
jgi:hypothetical protein